jgi:hypothetical protein
VDIDLEEVEAEAKNEDRENRGGKRLHPARKEHLSL